MNRKNIIALALLFMLLASACSQIEPPPETSVIVTENQTTGEISTAEIPFPKPKTQDELFDYVIAKWKSGEVHDLYEYADSALKQLLSEEDFIYMFESVSLVGGNLNEISGVKSSKKDGIVTYTSVLEFDNIKADIAVSFNELQIYSFYRNIYFNKSFEVERDDCTEQYFVLDNDGYKLNAVYTYINDGQVHPAVLLIAGSGPSDYNETIGILTPFENIAQGLAQKGINSLRIDKRTFNYADKLGKGGIQEEYLSDCRAALDYLKKQEIGNLYLIGHSLGGQIASELVVTDQEIDGIILFNSSARHLADIACDQYMLIDPNNKNLYIEYAETAKKLSPESAKGDYYYGASNYYWASYNQIDTLHNIKSCGINTLIINSTYDNQMFEEDIELWRKAFSDDEKIILRIFDDISYFGYKINTADQSSLYKRIEFPMEIIEMFSEFIK